MYINIPNLINLLTVSGVGSTRLRALISHFKDVDRVFQASLQELIDVDSVDQKTALQIRAFKDFDYGKKQCQTLDQIQGRIITFWDQEYPPLLKRMYDPPAYLFVKGELSSQDALTIAVVGSRFASTYGKQVTETITRQLAHLGITIVSGLARGVDTVAHWTAMQSGTRTIAVLGTGLDRIYPPENKKLAEQIETQGALVTEFHCGVGPDAVNFPRRNRIIAGLSRGTLVTEAGDKSGALITANIAVDNNRDVYAIPGNVLNNKSNGCHKLIKAGAKLVTNADDIIEETFPEIKNGVAVSPIQTDNLTVEEKAVISNLSNEPIHIDVLARKMNKASHEILITLLALEFNDFVKQMPGKYFILANPGIIVHGEQ
ncbi:DNA-processing protein DprA [candidate division KSB1 bacterium]|nr:DNA-processing protein DprA [candidate division KSB1 bacterium]